MQSPLGPKPVSNALTRMEMCYLSDKDGSTKELLVGKFHFGPLCIFVTSELDDTDCQQSQHGQLV